MKAYEKGLYDFLTTKDNFENACIVLDNFKMVKNELHRQFWAAVVEELRIHLGNEWRVEFNGVSQDQWNWAFYVFKPSWRIEGDKHWPVMAISWQFLQKNAFFGPWLNNRQSGVRIIDIHQKVRGLNAVIGRKEFGSWWPCKEDFRLDFDRRSTLKHMLPETRDPLISEILGNTSRWISELQGTFDDIAANDFGNWKTSGES